MAIDERQSGGVGTPQQRRGRARFFSSAGAVLRNLASLLVEAFNDWREERALELGAALAYYTALSMAPLLVIVIAVAGLVFGRDAVQGELFLQLRGLIGADGAAMLQAAVRSASKPTTGIMATLIGLLTLLVGASGVFAQLQESLNRIWRVEMPRGGWRLAMKKRLASFGMILVVGFVLLVSLAITAGLAALGRWLETGNPELQIVMVLLNQAVSLLVITVLFAMMFKILPDAHIDWRDVWVGALITAILFLVGRSLISFYVRVANVGAAYGMAGSIVVVLVWIYYSAQIFFFGAEVTEAYANRYGSSVRGPGGTRPAEDIPTPP